MNDYKEKPYAKFVEDTARMLFGFEPVAILVQALDEDGRVAEGNYNCDNGARMKIMANMIEDMVLDVITNNALQVLDVLRAARDEDSPEEPSEKILRLRELLERFNEEENDE